MELPIDCDFDQDPDDLEPRVYRFKFRGDVYESREADTGAAARCRSENLKCHKLDDGKLVRIEDTGKLEPLLVALCTFKAVPSKNGSTDFRRMAPEQINDWPSSKTKALYSKIREMSPGLEENETVESLEKQISRLTKRLEELRKTEGGDGAKNAPAGGGDSSAIAMSSDGSSTS